MDQGRGGRFTSSAAAAAAPPQERNSESCKKAALALAGADSNSKICLDYIKHKCSHRGNHGNFVHTKDCTFEKAGTCIAGARCFFRHAKPTSPAAKVKATAKGTPKKKPTKAAAVANFDDEDEGDEFSSPVFREATGNGCEE